MGVLPLPCLCLVTDRGRFDPRPIEEVVELAVVGGVNLVQLREKHMPAGSLFDLAIKLRSITQGKALLFVNDRVDVALACGADGVQLGEESLSTPVARNIIGTRLLIGRSIHSVEGAIEAEQQGANLLVAGTIFPSQSHTSAATAGVELLAQVRKEIKIPFLAIGGIPADNVSFAIKARASGAAVIGAIGASRGPTLAARGLWEAMARAWSTKHEGCDKR